MWWFAAIWLAQGLECPLEPQLALPPAGAWQELALKAVAAPKGWQHWEGKGIRVSRRAADGAVGLSIDGKLAELKPLGLLGWIGEGTEPYGRRGFERAPVAVRVRRATLGFGATEVRVERNGSVTIAARCNGALLVGDIEGRGPWGFDVNGDGKIDVNSPAEYARVKGEEANFEVDGKAWAVESVDWDKRLVRLRAGAPVPAFAIGDRMDDYAYTDRLGVTRRLSESEEDWTLLDFWASWCAPCIAAFPQLQAMREAYHVNVLGFNGDEDPEAASRTLAQFGVLWPDVQTTEPRGLHAARLRVAQYPTYVLLDRERRVVWRGESTVEAIEAIRSRARKRH